MEALINPYLRRATHPSSTGYLGGNLNAYFANTDGQFGVLSFLYKTSANSERDGIWLAWMRPEPALDLVCTLQPAPPSSALPRA